MIGVIDLAFYAASFVSLLTIVNPFSITSLFLSITQGDSAEKKRIMAKRASVTAAAVLIVFALVGDFILSIFSVTLDAFRIAGGLLIVNIGVRMISGTREQLRSEKEKKEAKEKDDVSIIPLAVPLLAGPGAMTTAIALMSEAGTIIRVGMLMLAIIIVCFISYFVLIKADLVNRFLGETGGKVVERVLGLIVMVVGVQFIINGISGVVSSWSIIA